MLCLIGQPLDCSVCEQINTPSRLSQVGRCFFKLIYNKVSHIVHYVNYEILDHTLRL